ncbi:MAG: hypothetical protein KAW17_03840 [Candidatus Eisenbacteria sp.]|nr:hypothetical protein [Candidatus Eisenbacteria bacterium]
MNNLVKVRLTSPQIKLIESVTAIPGNLEKSLREAVRSSAGTTRQIPYADLDQLAGWLAAEANREETLRRRRSLDRLYDEVQTALWEFDDRRIASGEPMPVVPSESILLAKPTKRGSRRKN